MFFGIFAGRRVYSIVLCVAFLMISGIASGVRMDSRDVSKLSDGKECTVRVMTFNIRVDTVLDVTNRWPQRCGKICDMIRDYQPDVLGIQEGLKHQVDEILDSVNGYEMTGVGRKDGDEKGEYSCILYRSDRFDLSKRDTFWLSGTPKVPGSRTWGNMWARTCTWARLVDRRTEKPFYVYNLHLDCISQRARENSVKLLVSYIRARGNDDPFIVTGDFNTGEGSDAMRFLMGRAALGGDRSPVKMIDTFRAINPYQQDVRTTSGLNSLRRCKKIDYILTQPDVRVIDANIMQTKGGRKASDHFPVTATVLIN